MNVGTRHPVRDSGRGATIDHAGRPRRGSRPYRGHPAVPAPTQTYYQILGIGQEATADEISAARRSMIKAVHPDVGGSAFLAAKINEAKDRLIGKHT